MSSTKDNLFDQQVYCPFYKGTEHAQLIRCEGPINGTTLRVGFTGKKACARYLEAYCMRKACDRCRIYQVAMKKYDEEEHHEH